MQKFLQPQEGIMSDVFTATVMGERAQEFIEVFGTPVVPIEFPYAVMAELGDEGEHPVFMLDLKRLTHEKYDRLVAHIMKKFNAPEAAVIEALREHGMPIKARDCVVTIHSWKLIG
jgi:hypothetical protein